MKPLVIRKHLISWLASVSLAVRLTAVQAASFSLSGDFSYTDNRTNSTWSYRTDDFGNNTPTFPLLTATNRDANALWGSDFAAPPRMWSDASG